jgi:hypothetical protein
MFRPPRTVDAVSERLRKISLFAVPGHKADVDDERTGVGGVGLLTWRGAVATGGLGIGVEGDGGTLKTALAGESTSSDP